MLTEDQLRDLLTRAGDSVRVDPVSPPVGAAPRPRRRGLAAAVAVAATLAGGVGLGWWWTGDGGADEAAPPVVLAGTPEGTVPSVFAHTRASATALLEDAGLRVDYRQEVSCDPAGRPVGTDPATGTAVEPGDWVTLLVSYQGAATDCFADLSEPWRFVDFATGRGAAPELADRVTLWVDGRRATTLSAADAGRGDWGVPSALTALRAAAGEVSQERGGFRMPELDVTWGTPPDAFCGIRRPAALGDREAMTLTVGWPYDALAAGLSACPARVSVYRTGGRIDAVVTWTERSSASAPDPAPVPDVVGMSLVRARNEVTAAGFAVRVEELQTCHPGRGVVDQAPSQQDLVDDAADDPGWEGPVTLVVEVPHRTRDCAGLDVAADGFLRFAAGGTPPRWAPEVQQLFGYALRDEITAAQADDPAAWSWCSGLAPADCRLSALAVAAEGDVTVAESVDSHECELIDEGGLPTGLSTEDAIVLFPTDPSSCDADWTVQLWIDDAGGIVAVNLLVAQSVGDSE